MNETREILLVDSTLRDGHQSPGLALSLEDRLELAEALDLAGIYRIEAGSPAMGDTEVETILALRKKVKRAQISTWNRLNLDDIRRSIKAQPDIIHICFPVSDRQMKAKLKTSWYSAVELLAESLSLCKSHGFKVSVGLEDISRASVPHLLKVMDCLKILGVTDLRLADTVGILTPQRTKELVRLFVERDFIVEFHAHNDLGIASANSLVAALSGAALIDTTLGGVGERAGNCSLSGFLSLLRHAKGLSAKATLAASLSLEEGFLPKLRRESYLKDLIASRSSDITNFGGLCLKET
jgi:homocitrate synthase NifV